jgi:hypothetical protein
MRATCMAIVEAPRLPRVVRLRRGAAARTSTPDDRKAAIFESERRAPRSGIEAMATAVIDARVLVADRASSRRFA